MSHQDLKSFPDLFKVIQGPEGTYTSALISLQDFKAGSVLAILGEECQLTNKKAYTSVQIADDSSHQESHIELRSDLVYINHSCDPNVVFDLPNGLDGLSSSNWTLKAIKDIKNGDPLTFAYFTTEWDMAQPFDCRCGSINCLGKIQGAKYISSEILNQYFINDHIKKLKLNQKSTQDSK